MIDGAISYMDADHNQNRVVFLGLGGRVWQSLDRGESWKVLWRIPRASNWFESIRLAGEELWIVGDLGHCMRVNLNTLEEADCGIQSKLWIFDIAAHGKSLVASASEGTLFISTDGGRSWRTQVFEGRDELVSVDFFDDGSVIAAGGVGEGFIPMPQRIAVRSEDLRHWERISLPSCPSQTTR